MKENSLLVLARKFNDIFYAISTPEWRCYDYHILVIFAQESFATQFPLRERFDKVFVFDSPTQRKEELAVIREIKAKKSELQCEAVMLSNIVLVANQYLIKATQCKHIYLLEDGLMNYSDFRPSDSRIKFIVQCLLGINQRKLIERIQKTYLLIPDMARFYGGERVQLKPLSLKNIEESILSRIEGKKIFVGQCLYRFGYMSIEKYNALVNRMIKKYNIDFYLPHAFSLEGEQIDCPILDLAQSGITLEFLAAETSFTLYSFSSSVLYTTRIINPAVKTYLIQIPEQSNASTFPIFRKYCSGIIEQDCS